MYASMWSYPWDFVDVGMDQALDELQEAGLSAVSMITSYHAGRFLQVRSPKRKVYFPQDGTAYFAPAAQRYQGLPLAPLEADFHREHPDFWPQLFQKAKKRGMKVSGWTVCLHNTRLGMAYPQACVRNAYGDAAYYNLCPSNPQVRRYFLTLLEDLLDQAPLDSIELESMNFMGFAHEYHHEKDGVGLTAKDDFLLSLCFCPSCRQRAMAAGIPFDEAQAQAKTLIDELCRRPVPKREDGEFFAQGVDFFAPWPALHAFLRWRSEPVTSLMREVRAVTEQKGCQLYFLSLLTPDRTFLFGVDFSQIAEACDGIVVCCYDGTPARALSDMRLARAQSDRARLLTGLRVFTPEVSGEAELVEKMKNAALGSAEGFVLYNYGLIPRERLRWIRSGLEAIKG